MKPNTPSFCLWSDTRHLLVGGIAVLGAAVGHIGSAAAATIDLGNPDWALRWDNTLSYTAATRTLHPSSQVAENPGINYNVNDGDRNFNRGLIENRFDILSELDLTYRKSMGVRFSGAAWYDTVYNQHNDNRSGSVNKLSGRQDAFPDATEVLMGRDADLLDAFAWGDFKLPEGVSMAVKAGQFTQLYGESLFLGANAFAGAQTPIDLIKALSLPGAQFKEVAMPVPQMSTTFQLSPRLTVQGYYQFKWRPDRLPPVGSYFSFADFAGPGGDKIFVPGIPPSMNVFLQGSPEMKAGDTGQGGGIVKYKLTPNWEFGVFGANFNAKDPKWYARTGVNAQGPIFNGPALVGVSAGDYVPVYPQDIHVYGASFATVIGDTNVSGEASVRTNQPLATSGSDLIMAGPTCNNSNNPCYALGRTFHANMSAISVFSESSLWDGASLTGELGYNYLIGHDNNVPVDPNTTPSAWGVRATFEPSYFQALPGLDITTPITVGYAFGGRSVLGPTVFGPEYGGDVTIGIKGVYLGVYKAGLTFTHYYGSGGPVTTDALQYSYKQFWKDRDWVSLTLQASF